MVHHPARILTFLAPNMLSTYEAITTYLSQKLGYPMELAVGSSYDEIYTADFSFICGLPYVLRTAIQPRPITAIAAPVLRGDRYQAKPIYFSDVIVHRESRFQSFADLRGCSWAYNEPESQSGYGITRYWLAKQGFNNGYFGQVIEAGFHQTAIRLVAERQVDASAIDSLVLQIELEQHPELAQQLRIIDSLGPSTIQPFTVSAHVPATMITDVQNALITMHNEEGQTLRQAGISHFVTVTDSDYDDIRNMLNFCAAANFMTLR